MVRTLQKKFIKASMIAVSLLILAIFIALNIFNYVSTHNTLRSTMALLSEYEGDRGRVPKEMDGYHNDRPLPPDGNDGFSPEEDFAEENDFDYPDEFFEDDFDDRIPDEEFINGFMEGRVSFKKTDRDIFLTSPYFMVRLNSGGEVVYSDISQISSLTGETASAIALEVCSRDLTSGYIGSYMYSILENDVTGGRTVIFLDTSADRSKVIQILLVSLGISLGAWLAMLAFVIFLSKRAIKPIAENIERQKQFVTNAGHELKTPLAVIQSNTEAMELFNGENKWSRNIKAQVTRLSALTKNLLTLSRMDESSDSMVIENLDFSGMVNEQLQTFASSFERKGLTVSADVEENVHLKGDRGQLSQLLGLLFDNACKYANENGQLNVSLEKKGSKIMFVSKNTCDELPSAPPERLFDRFYRSDESHSQKTSGQGIGLSVAAAIAQNHRGTITAQYNNEGPAVSFILKL